MALNAADIKFYESANAGSDSKGNLGGAITITEVSTTVNQFFDLISPAEAVAGMTDYRCFYIKNTSTTNDLLNGTVTISGTPSDANTKISIGLVEVNTTAQAITNELTVPSGITFVEQGDVSLPLTMSANLVQGQHVAVWVKREVSSGVGAISDGCTIRVNGETAP